MSSLKKAHLIFDMVWLLEYWQTEKPEEFVLKPHRNEKEQESVSDLVVSLTFCMQNHNCNTKFTHNGKWKYSTAPTTMTTASIKSATSCTYLFICSRGKESGTKILGNLLVLNRRKFYPATQQQRIHNGGIHLLVLQHHHQYQQWNKLVAISMVSGWKLPCR
jgi:hypothetical protein